MPHYESVQASLRKTPATWLITGVAGFVGSNLLEALLRLDQFVVGIDNFSTGHQRNLDEVRRETLPRQWSNFTHISGDIRALQDCRRAMEALGEQSRGCGTGGIPAARYILHQAAIGSVPRSISDPINTNQNNIDGFLNMLVAARDENVDRFVFAASSSTYGDHPSLPKREDQIGRPLSPYAVTKLANELYADVFSRTYSLSTVGLRYFNLFGRRQDPAGPYAAVIPKWIASLLDGIPIYINGDGTTSRDFCYVQNAVQANILAATSLHYPYGPSIEEATTSRSVAGCSIYNVAVGERTSLNELHELINRTLKALREPLPSPLVEYRPFRAGDIKHSLADISKIRSELGYQPTHEIAQGLLEAMPWYIANARASKA